MDKDKFLKDAEFNKRDSVFLDIDRIIDEGLAGGNVYTSGNNQNIEEAHEFYDETPPNVNRLD